jgi:hypothetical protein
LLVFDAQLHGFHDSDARTRSGFTAGILDTAARALPLNWSLSNDLGVASVGATIRVPAKQGLGLDWSVMEPAILAAASPISLPVITGSNDEAISSLSSASPGTQPHLTRAQIAKYEEERDNFELQLAIALDDDDDGPPEVDFEAVMLTFFVIGVMGVITSLQRTRKPARLMTTNSDLASIIAQGLRPQKKRQRLDPEAWVSKKPPE